MELDRTSGAARQALVATGVAGGALVLSLAAAVPAVAGNVTGNGEHGTAPSHARAAQAEQHAAAAAHRHGHGQSSTHGQAETSDAADANDNAATDGSSHGGAGQATAAAHRPAGHGSTGTGSSDNGAAATHSSGKPAGHNPPGNNGTVFIHDVAGDYSPHNVPHVPCTFYADFFGFDLGQQVTVSFAGQAPTGMGTPLQGTWTGTVSDDDAGGAGQDFDLELPFSADTLGVTSLGAPHPKQGYHVKMTVLTNEPGGKKSKVFWISPCADTAGTAGTASTPGTAVGGEDVQSGTTETTGTEGETADTAAVAGSTTAAGTVAGRSAAGPSATVLGEHFYRGMAAGGTAAAAGSLPFTGAETGALLLAGAAALGGGAALMVAGRRRRTAPANPTD